MKRKITINIFLIITFLIGIILCIYNKVNWWTLLLIILSTCEINITFENNKI